MFSKTADWIGEKDFVPPTKKGSYKYGWEGHLLPSFCLAGELESTSAEYQLLEQMNR